MSEAVAKLKPLLAALTAVERAEVAEYLTALNNGHTDEDGEENLTPEEWEAAWAAEIDRRIEEARNGKSDSIPHEEFMRQMKEKYG